MSPVPITSILPLAGVEGASETLAIGSFSLVVQIRHLSSVLASLAFSFMRR